jgi:ribosomal protein S14
MLFKKLKDQKIRKAVKKAENFKKVNKFLNYHFLLETKKSSITLNVKSVLSRSQHRITKTRVTRRCILTNRNRGITRPYNISRTVLRELMQFSVLPGYSKAVW